MKSHISNSKREWSKFEEGSELVFQWYSRAIYNNYVLLPSFVDFIFCGIIQIVARALVILGFLVLLIECKFLHLSFALLFILMLIGISNLIYEESSVFLLIHNIFSVGCRWCANLTNRFCGAVLGVRRTCNLLLAKVLFMRIDGDFFSFIHFNYLFVCGWSFNHFVVLQDDQQKKFCGA